MVEINVVTYCTFIIFLRALLGAARIFSIIFYALAAACLTELWTQSEPAA